MGGKPSQGGALRPATPRATPPTAARGCPYETWTEDEGEEAVSGLERVCGVEAPGAGPTAARTCRQPPTVPAAGARRPPSRSQRGTYLPHNSVSLWEPKEPSSNSLLPGAQQRAQQKQRRNEGGRRLRPLRPVRVSVPEFGGTGGPSLRFRMGWSHSAGDRYRRPTPPPGPPSRRPRLPPPGHRRQTAAAVGHTPAAPGHARPRQGGTRPPHRHAPADDRRDRGRHDAPRHRARPGRGNRHRGDTPLRSERAGVAPIQPGL